jgi:hypothetical protein
LVPCWALCGRLTVRILAVNKPVIIVVDTVGAGLVPCWALCGRLCGRLAVRIVAVDEPIPIVVDTV